MRDHILRRISVGRRGKGWNVRFMVGGRRDLAFLAARWGFWVCFFMGAVFWAIFL